MPAVARGTQPCCEVSVFIGVSSSRGGMVWGVTGRRRCGSEAPRCERAGALPLRPRSSSERMASGNGLCGRQHEHREKGLSLAGWLTGAGRARDAQRRRSRYGTGAVTNRPHARQRALVLHHPPAEPHGPQRQPAPGDRGASSCSGRPPVLRLTEVPQRPPRLRPRLVALNGDACCSSSSSARPPSVALW